MSGFTDIHSHFIYGVDDGARTREDMEAMLDAAHADGISDLYATPHIALGIRRFQHELFRRHFQEAEVYCRQRGYGMRLHAGAELLYTPAMQPYIVERKLPSLGDSNHVLVEFTPDISYLELEAAVGLMERAGYIPVLAHIERYGCFFHGKKPWRLKERHEVRYQVNADSALERRALFRGGLIKRWFQEELIDFVASDAHDCEGRPFRMRAAYDALAHRYGQERAARLAGAEKTCSIFGG